MNLISLGLIAFLNLIFLFMFFHSKKIFTNNLEDKDQQITKLQEKLDKKELNEKEYHQLIEKNKKTEELLNISKKELKREKEINETHLTNNKTYSDIKTSANILLTSLKNDHVEVLKKLKNDLNTNEKELINLKSLVVEKNLKVEEQNKEIAELNFANQYLQKIAPYKGEKEVISLLDEFRLNPEYSEVHFFNNITFKNLDINAKFRQIDHMIVSKNGITIIETKNWSGRTHLQMDLEPQLKKILNIRDQNTLTLNVKEVPKNKKNERCWIINNYGCPVKQVKSCADDLIEVLMEKFSINISIKQLTLPILYYHSSQFCDKEPVDQSTISIIYGKINFLRDEVTKHLKKTSSVFTKEEVQLIASIVESKEFRGF